MQKKTKIKLSLREMCAINELLQKELQNTVDIRDAALLSVILDLWMNCMYKYKQPKSQIIISIPYPVALCFYAFYNGRKIDNEEVYLLVNKILAEIDKTIDSQIRLKSFEVSDGVCY